MTRTSEQPRSAGEVQRDFNQEMIRFDLEFERAMNIARDLRQPNTLAAHSEYCDARR